MAFQEALFRNSVWSHDQSEMLPQELARGEALGNNVGNEKMCRVLVPVSKFSLDSDYDDNRHPRLPSSAAFPNNSHTQPHVREWARIPKPGSALCRLRALTPAQQPPRYTVSWPRHSRGYEKRPERQPRPNAAAQEDEVISGELDMPLLQKILLVAIICMAHVCVQAGIGQTLPMMKSIGSRFRIANVNTLSSSIAGYNAAVGTFVLVAGRLGEIFGRKWIFIVGLEWSAVWSLVAGASFYSTQSLYITSRVAQGLGAALVLPTGLDLLKAIVPAGIHREVIFALYAAMSPVGLIGGAVVASMFDEFVWWPWTYWSFSVMLFVLGVIGCFIIPLTARAGDMPPARRVIILELDLPGIITGVMSLGLFGYAWGQAHVIGWQQPYLWAILLISVALAAIFVMIEAYYAQKPLIPSSALSLEVFWTLVAFGCGWACFGIWSFYTWQFVERLRSTPPLLVTAYFTPIIVVGCFAVVITPLILHKVGPHSLFCAALLGMVIGSLLVSTMTSHETYWERLFVSIIFMAWGLYTSAPAAAMLVLGVVKKRSGYIVARLIFMVAYYGMGSGLAIAGTVESNIMSGKLTVRNRLRGYKAVFWTSFGLATLGFAVCLALALVERGRKSATQGRDEHRDSQL